MHNQCLNACKEGDLAEAQRLVSKVYVSFRNQALIEGILLNNTTNNILMMLVNNGTDINLRTEDYKVPYFLTECHKGNINTISKFLELGVDVNIQNDEGEGPLHKAVRSGKIDAVKLILGATGLNIDLKRNNGETALKMAADATVQEIGNTLTFDLIFKAGLRAYLGIHGNNAKTAYIKNHCQEAVDTLKKCDRLDIKSYLLNNGLLDLDQNSLDRLLIRACEAAHYDLVKYFYDTEADFYQIYKNENAIEILERTATDPRLKALTVKIKLDHELDLDDILVRCSNHEDEYDEDEASPGL